MVSFTMAEISVPTFQVGMLPVSVILLTCAMTTPPLFRVA
jgi:hypothetical protein